MADADSIMSGIFIGGIVVIGLGVLNYCYRRHRQTGMKQSSSETNLTQLGDPEMV